MTAAATLFLSRAAPALRYSSPAPRFLMRAITRKRPKLLGRPQSSCAPPTTPPYHARNAYSRSNSLLLLATHYLQPSVAEVHTKPKGQHICSRAVHLLESQTYAFNDIWGTF